MSTKRILALVLSALMLFSVIPSVTSASAVGENLIAEATSDGRSYYLPGTEVEFENGSTVSASQPFNAEQSLVDAAPNFSNYGEVTGDVAIDGYTTRKVTDPRQIAEILGYDYTPASETANWLPDYDEFANELVKVIVVLEGAPLSSDASLGIKVGTKVDRQSYLSAKKLLLSAQNIVLSQIRSTTHSTATCLANYFITTNGMAIEIERGHIAAINAMEGVKIAFESPVFEVEPDDIFNTGDELQGTMLAWDAGYKGEGMAVAIIDTGLYTSHRAFQTDPTNPKYTKESIAALLEQYDFNAETLMDGYTADNAYHSAKVPFMFDYAQNDADVTHTNGVSAHGTHVAGIVGAFEATHDGVEPGVVGAAPEAQIIPLKVFDGEGASFANIMLAMDDAILLGVDAVNLSLGSPAGNDYDEGITEVFDAANAAGITVVVSAGNEANSAIGNRWGNNRSMALNPDNGIVGSPGSYASNLTVASVNSLTSYKISGATYLTYGLNPVWGDPWECDFYDYAPTEYLIRTVLGGQIVPFVTMTDWEWDNYDLEGKLAFVLESEDIPTQELYDTAVEKGAVAMVVVPYNEDDDWAYDMEIESYEAMPAVSCMLWNYTDLLYYIDHHPDFDYMIKIPERYVDTVDGGEISDFSSRGTTQDLSIKPEIAAVGGHVYSTWNYNSYADSSGTSMAAPQVAAAAVLARQALKDRYPDLTVNELHDMATAILMSTASQVLVKGIPASPRDQGAGLINIEKAVNATTFITVDGCDKPKFELGDDPDRTGEYTLDFNVVNLGDTEKTYSIAALVQTERAMGGEIRDDEPIYFMYGEPYALNSELSGDTEITVPAGGKASASITIKLSDSDLEYINECYENGIYVEGYLTLTDVEENGMNLSAPFLAFYGDWTALSLMDLTFGYDTLWETPVDLDYSSVMPHMVLTSINGEPHYLGDNLSMRLNPTIAPYGYYAWDDIRCYISPNGDGICDGIEAVYTSVLRNASNVIYKITDTTTGEVYYEKELGGWTKYTMDEDGNQLPIGMDEYSFFDPWYGTDAEGNTLPDGTEVYVSIELEMMYRGEVVTDNALTSWGFLCCIDTVEPELSVVGKMQGSGNYSGWHSTLTAIDEGIVSVFNFDRYSQLNDGTMRMDTVVYCLDLERGKNMTTNSFMAGSMYYLYVYVQDYAGNDVLYLFDNRQGDTMVDLDCDDDVYLVVGDTLDIANAFDFSVIEITETLALTFTNSNPEVATIASTGIHSGTVTALAVGETVITAAYPRTAGSDTVTVHVGEADYTVTATANEGGTITPAGETAVPYRESLAYSFVADEHYHIADVIVDGESVGISNGYVFEAVEAAHSIEVVFAKDEFEIVFIDGLNGSVIETQQVAYGETVVPPEAPVHEGYTFVSWVGEMTVSGDSYIVAFYDEDEVPAPATVSIVLIDGLTNEVIETQQVTVGGSVILPEAPEHDGYSFVAWEGVTENVTEDGVVVATYKRDFVLGDANMDGEVTAKDASQILRYLVGWVTEDQIDLEAADVDGDGYVTAVDAAMILRYLVGINRRLSR